MEVLNILKKTVKFAFDSDFRFRYLSSRGCNGDMPAEEFLKRMYRIRMQKDLNLDAPVTYTEKVQWLKLHDCRSDYTHMVDKYAVKELVARKIGSEYVIPLLGVWDTAKDIDFESLPDRFVLKATHDSGSIVICESKSELDVRATRKKLQRSLDRDYYACNREWPYKNVPHRIIAEEFLGDDRRGGLRDYKFFTFGGVPKVLYITQGRGRGVSTTADFYDMDFNHLPFTIDHSMAQTPPEKPKNFELMKELAAALSKGTPQLRVDFYEVNGKVYFGEMTFFHCSGMHPFCPESWDRTFGDWVILPPRQV